MVESEILVGSVSEFSSWDLLFLEVFLKGREKKIMLFYFGSVL